MSPELLVSLFYGYLALGALFGIYFVGWGAPLIDAEARGMPLRLRVLLWPASAALWPVLLQKVLCGRKVPAEPPTKPTRP